MPVQQPDTSTWGKGRNGSSPTSVDIANAEVLRRLSEWSEVAAFGVVWTAPPTPFLDGVELAQIRADFDRAAEAGDRAGIEDAHQRAVPIIRRIMRPVPIVRRVLYRLGLWRPWRNMSAADFARVMGFLLTSRTRSTVTLSTRARS